MTWRSTPPPVSPPDDFDRAIARHEAEARAEEALKSLNEKIVPMRREMEKAGLDHVMAQGKKGGGSTRL